MDVLRQEGLARVSRPLRATAGVRLVTSQLGPGYVRGDSFAVEGSVGAGATLVVTAQAAGRALGSGAASAASATWHVHEDATLHLLGEPLIAYEGARHRATLDVTLGAGATFAFIDVVAANGDVAGIDTQLRVRCEGRLIVHDALRLGPEHLRGAIGTAVFLRCGAPDAADAARLRHAECCATAPGIRLSAGTTRAGGLVVRARGPRAGLVREALVRAIGL